jgi:hypothetical protein
VLLDVHIIKGTDFNVIKGFEESFHREIAENQG